MICMDVGNCCFDSWKFQLRLVIIETLVKVRLDTGLLKRLSKELNAFGSNIYLWKNRRIGRSELVVAFWSFVVGYLDA